MINERTLFTVDGWNNFCRVFKLPQEFSNKFCFGRGIATEFRMIDWFSPIVGLQAPAITQKEWIDKGMIIESSIVSIEEITHLLVQFISKKQYYSKEDTFIVICDFGAVVMVNNNINSK